MKLFNFVFVVVSVYLQMHMFTWILIFMKRIYHIVDKQFTHSFEL